MLVDACRRVYARRERLFSRLFIVLPALLASIAMPAKAGAQTVYTSGSGVSISGPTASGTSTLSVSGASGTVASISVQLSGVNSSNSTDGNGKDFSVDYTAFTLTSPDGRKFELLGCTGNAVDQLSNATINISDIYSPIGANNAWPGGGRNLSPSSYWTNANECAEAVPASLAGFGLPQTDGAATLSSAFVGASPNGTWTLGVINALPSGYFGKRSGIGFELVN